MQSLRLSLYEFSFYNLIMDFILIKKRKTDNNKYDDNQKPPKNPNGSATIVEPRQHHIRQPLCTTRPEYRRGKRRETAVKAYTVADESQYLLFHNVPTLSGVNMRAELKTHCRRYGTVNRIEPVVYQDTSQPSFSQVFLVKFDRLVDAIHAKKRLDDFVLLGSSLHVCYAPEFESIEDTQNKLEARNRYVRIKIAQFKNLTAATSSE